MRHGNRIYIPQKLVLRIPSQTERGNPLHRPGISKLIRLGYIETRLPPCTSQSSYSLRKDVSGAANVEYPVYPRVPGRESRQ